MEAQLNIEALENILPLEVENKIRDLLDAHKVLMRLYHSHADSSGVNHAEAYEQRAHSLWRQFYPDASTFDIRLALCNEPTLLYKQAAQRVLLVEVADRFSRGNWIGITENDFNLVNQEATVIIREELEFLK